MKAVLISIRPEWCVKIANGEKKIEVRKTRPKLETPFKCYIYCTLPRYPHEDFIEADYPKPQFYGGGKVIGEFICDRIYELETRSPGGSYYVKGEGRPTTNDVARQSCLTLKDMHEYLQSKVGYGWHILDLKIYDNPLELSKFRVEDKAAIKACKHRFRAGQPEYVARHGGWLQGGWGCMKTGEPEWCENCLTKPLTSPPQSWCYVEETDNDKT
jgi:predicted transcriptional regulator